MIKKLLHVVTIFLLTTLSQRKTRVKLCTAQFLFNSSKGDLSFLALLIFIVDVFRQVRILVGLPPILGSVFARNDLEQTNRGDR